MEADEKPLHDRERGERGKKTPHSPPQEEKRCSRVPLQVGKKESTVEEIPQCRPSGEESETTARWHCLTPSEPRHRKRGKTSPPKRKDGWGRLPNRIFARVRKGTAIRELSSKPEARHNEEERGGREGEQFAFY